MTSCVIGCGASPPDAACVSFRRLDLSDQLIDASTRDDTLQLNGHNDTWDRLCRRK